LAGKFYPTVYWQKCHIGAMLINIADLVVGIFAYFIQNSYTIS